MTNLFQPNEFDDWAANYDRNVNENSSFPFEGYSSVLQTIVDEADIGPNSSVLDLGIGTGNLALLFANRGCEIWGLDFSAEMLALAKTKLPNATLGQVDLRAEWPSSFKRKFDLIVSAYTFHHFPWEQKVGLILDLLNKNLLPGGQLIIGDIAFRNAEEEDALRCKLGDGWEEEYYWLANETLAHFKTMNISIRFIKISYCAGVFILTSKQKYSEQLMQKVITVARVSTTT